ncbi:MAG: hypothetical protein GXO78_14455 [Calditrichaeota bacterium]|nr:hypothetical protein [Calditrichota bacterium]
MKRFQQMYLTLLMIFGISIYGSVLFAQEHPTTQEHPTKKKEKQEHPTKSKAKEHPSEHPTSKARKITKETLAEAIEAYVNAEAKKHDGYFVFMDDKEKKELKLKLVKVHKERLARISEDVYFACADFKTPDGQVYDLDIFMKGKTADDLTFTEIMLHKKNGVPRYTWYEENGVWKRKPVE